MTRKSEAAEAARHAASARDGASAQDEASTAEGSGVGPDPEVEPTRHDEAAQTEDSEVLEAELLTEFIEGELEEDEEAGQAQAGPDYLDDLRRLQAEFENYKKQVVRRQAEHLERAAESIVTNLLPVLDAGDNARAHGSQEAAGLAGLLYDSLRKEGLEGLGSQPGDGFDPTLHDAVAHEPADENDEEQEGSVIAEVLREGYTWKGRLLRPAMVRVKG